MIKKNVASNTAKTTNPSVQVWVHAVKWTTLNENEVYKNE